METLVESIDAFDPFSDSHDDFATAVPSAARQFRLDGEGRIVLPEGFLEHSGITDNAMFVGRGKTFQIWRPETFDAYAEEARARARERRGELRWKETSKGEAE